MTVTAPKGFTAAGVAAGLKKSGDPDVALVVNDGPAFAAAGVFTANRVQAAPVPGRSFAGHVARIPRGIGASTGVHDSDPAASAWRISGRCWWAPPTL